MGWTYQVDVELIPKAFETTLTLSTFGGVDMKLKLDVLPTVVSKTVIEGGIDYDCTKSKFQGSGGEGACVMYTLKRRPPFEKATMSATLLKDSVPGGLTIGPLKVKTTLKQPTVTVTPTMQVTASNENQCYNVFIDVTAEFTPGRVDFSIAVPTPIPGLGTLTLDAFALVGKASKTRLQAEYRICCCAWNDDLPADPEAPKDEVPHIALDQGDLKCGETATFLSCDVSGDKSQLAVTIKASESECPFSIRQSKALGKLAKTKAAAPKAVVHP